MHLYGVAQLCALIALRRGENVELAVMAGVLHDIYTYANLDPADHARKGAALARDILVRLQITKDDETRIICDAIHAHSDKEQTNSPFDEVLKDADSLQFWLHDPLAEHLTQTRKDRCDRLMVEFGILRDVQ